MSRKLFVVASFLGVVCFTPTVNATLIGSFTATEAGGEATTTLSGLELTIDIGGDLPFTSVAPIFDKIPISAGDAGAQFSISSGPVFDMAVDILTNRTDDLIGVSDGLGGSSGFESVRFFSGVGGPDFQGQSISEITATIDAVSIESPGTDPSGNGIWTDHSLTVTVRVYAQWHLLLKRNGASRPVAVPETPQKHRMACAMTASIPLEWVESRWH